MAHGRSDDDRVRTTHNTARFFTETRHIAWVLLLATVAWGLYGYWRMPQRKDPDIPIRQALTLVSWPGASAERIEQLITRRVEEKIAENAKVDKVESNTRTGQTAIYITLVEDIKEVGKEFDDIKMKLDTLQGQLPEGAGPIVFVKDFGDTAALMLTVASPKTPAVEIALRADAMRQTIERVRDEAIGGRRPDEEVDGFSRRVRIDRAWQPVRERDARARRASLARVPDRLFQRPRTQGDFRRCDLRAGDGEH